MSAVSIIIPTLNEARVLERTLRCLSLLNPPPWEVLVVDGGSHDGTVTVAQDWSVSCSADQQMTVIKLAESGRSTQMNAGAKAATGDIFCFLHADTLVPDDLITLITGTLDPPQVVCGGFISLMVGDHTTRWGTSLHNYLKTYYSPCLFRPHLFWGKGLRILFGDQAIFCQRQAFWNCGGFDISLPIMEDADLCLRMIRQGKIQLVNRVIQSSDRRLAKWGQLKTTAIYLGIGCLWALGVPATHLHRFYEDIR